MNWPRSRRRATRRSAAGFTLIETIVVLVILGLALSVVAGFLPRHNTALELSSATSRVAGALRLARSRALAESRSVTIAGVPDGHGFLVDSKAVVFDRSAVVIVIQPRAILFAADGSASGGSISVSLDGRRRVVNVDWLTGRVSVDGAS